MSPLAGSDVPATQWAVLIAIRSVIERFLFQERHNAMVSPGFLETGGFSSVSSGKRDAGKPSLLSR